MQSSLRDFKRSHIELNSHVKSVSAMCLMNFSKNFCTNDQQNVESYLVSVCRGGSIKLWDINSSSRMHLSDTVNFYYDYNKYNLLF